MPNKDVVISLNEENNIHISEHKYLLNYPTLKNNNKLELDFIVKICIIITI